LSILAATDVIVRNGHISTPRPKLNANHAKAWLKWMAKKMSDCAEKDLETKSYKAAKLKKDEGLEDELWLLAPQLFVVWANLQLSTAASASSPTPSTPAALATTPTPPTTTTAPHSTTLTSTSTAPPSLSPTTTTTTIVTTTSVTAPMV
jgi:hypothetical protein